MALRLVIITIFWLPAITSEHSFLWEIMWRSKAPPRVVFFVWTTALGKILKIDKGRER